MTEHCYKIRDSSAKYYYQEYVNNVLRLRIAHQNMMTKNTSGMFQVCEQLSNLIRQSLPQQCVKNRYS